MQSAEKSLQFILKEAPLTVIICVLILLVARFAIEKIQPLVSEMDKNSVMDESIITGMFEQGVRTLSLHFLV